MINIYRVLSCMLILWMAAASAGSAQALLTVRGQVTSSDDGKGLPGVNIFIKGSTTGTVSDSEGKYALEVPGQEAVLVFSFIGYTAHDVAVAGRSVIDVTLMPDITTLDEIVVIGYGEQSRSTLTTSVSKVNEAEFSNATAANPLLQLQGKVAGVSIQASSGQPGANPQIFIRGGSSSSPENDAPLFIVDGIVGVMRNISDLNPDDIESMQVLKDAASTAIYGARAANGVIIIKTKSGKANKPAITFKFTSGIDHQAKQYNFVNARDYIYVSRLNTMKYNKSNPDFYLSGGTYGMSTGNPRNSKNTLEFLDTYLQNYGQEYVAGLLENEGWQTTQDPVTGKQLIFKGTDYQDVTYQTASRKEYDLSIGGGNDRSTYYLGLGHLDQQGIIYGTFYKNYSALFNGTYKLSNKWSLNAGLSYQVRYSNAPNNDNNVLSRSVTTPPTYRLYYENGLPAPGEGIASFRSRLHEVYYKEKYTDTKVYRSTINLGATWDILPGLSFSPSAVWFTTEGIENYFEAYNEVNPNRNASSENNFDRQAQLDALLNYDKTLSGGHHISAVLGTSYINTYTYRLSGSGRNGPSDNITTVNATAQETQRTSSTMSTDIVMSYFGRASYDFNKKYLLSASMRVDGSSRFADDHKWGVFPGVSAGWNIHEENFWTLGRYISNFKLRSSYGEVGNNTLTVSDSQGAYAIASNETTPVPHTYDGQVGILNTVLANKNLIWETTTSFDIGVDMGLLNDKITLSVDYYNKLTTDRLFSKPLPSTSGFNNITSNYGSIRNRGFEVELGATPVKTGNFSWDLAFTFALNRGTVVELPDNGEAKNRVGGNYVYDYNTKEYVKVGGSAEGERFGQRYAYHMAGVYATDADAADAPYDVAAAGRVKGGGDAIWNDLDGNGRIENTDMIFMGYIRPDKTGGMVNTLKYQGLTLRCVVDYAVGHVIDNGFRAKANGSARNNNVALTDVLSDAIWKDQGDIATIPKYSVQSDFDYTIRNHQRPDNAIGNTGTASNSSLYYSKGDFLAFREISLSYQLKSQFLKQVYLQGVELFAGLYNIGYITDYDGLMPEVYTGVDPGLYPRPRQFNVGIKASF